MGIIIKDLNSRIFMLLNILDKKKEKYVVFGIWNNKSENVYKITRELRKSRKFDVRL